MVRSWHYRSLSHTFWRPFNKFALILRTYSTVWIRHFMLLIETWRAFMEYRNLCPIEAWWIINARVSFQYSTTFPTIPFTVWTWTFEILPPHYHCMLRSVMTQYNLLKDDSKTARPENVTYGLKKTVSWEALLKFYLFSHCKMGEIR